MKLQALGVRLITLSIAIGCMRALALGDLHEFYDLILPLLLILFAYFADLKFDRMLDKFDVLIFEMRTMNGTIGLYAKNAPPTVTVRKTLGKPNLFWLCIGAFTAISLALILAFYRPHPTTAAQSSLHKQAESTGSIHRSSSNRHPSIRTSHE